MTTRPCIICGKPRDGTRLWCGSDDCFCAVEAVPTEELRLIRERECIEAFRQAPADGRGVYIHVTPRE